MGISIERTGGGWNEARAGRSVVYDLAETALNAADTAERLRAVTMLGRCNDPRAVRPLMDLLEDKEPSIRLCATVGLGLLRSGRPVDDLIGRLRDRSEQAEIRHQAVISLAAIRSTGAIHGLREFAADTSEDAALRATVEATLHDIIS
ncbi:MAG: HEAT repeat domain-containing protein [Methanomicrobiales archaeon]|nr:HEAT repeat domain-containing protein [Methanomicrobiales archaeon]